MFCGVLAPESRILDPRAPTRDVVKRETERPRKRATLAVRGGGATALESRARVSPCGIQRRASMLEVLSPSLRAHIGYFGSAAATKCVSPATMAPFQTSKEKRPPSARQVANPRVLCEFIFHVRDSTFRFAPPRKSNLSPFSTFKNRKSNPDSTLGRFDLQNGFQKPYFSESRI